MVARSVLAVGVVLLGVLLPVAALAQRAGGAPTPRFVGPTLAHPAVAPDFALRDQRRQVIRLSHQRGNVVLLTFLYAHCPDFCPLTAMRLNEALRLLGQARKKVVVLAVSVDPAGDTPAAVKAFVRDHRLRPQFHYLTGRAKTLERIWHAYHVSAVRKNGAGVDHTLYTLLLDRSGKGRVLFDTRARPTAVAHDVRLLLR